MSLKPSTRQSSNLHFIRQTSPSSFLPRPRTHLRKPTTRPYSPSSHTHAHPLNSTSLGPGPNASHAHGSSTIPPGGPNISSTSHGGVGGLGSTLSSPSSTAGVGAGAGAAGAGAGKRTAPPSRHLVWYREIVPAMMPVIGIGTAIFFALQLIQTHLSHSRSLSDAQIRITHLESELAHLQSIQRRQAVSWGDSLGRVIKVVQEVAVGPKVAEGEGGVGGVAEAGKVGNKYVDQSTTTSTTPVVPSTPTTMTTTTTTDPSTQLEPGLETLVDRVKNEFGGSEVQGTSTKSRWTSWWGSNK